MVESYPINLAGCGVLTILKEAGRLLSNYIRLLHPFIFTFLLPVALLHVVEVIAISRISSHWVLHQFGGSAIHRWMPHPHHHHQHFGFFVSGTSPKATFGPDEYASPHPSLWMDILIVSFAVSTSTWVLVSIATASISKTVEYIYAGDEADPSIIKSIFRSLPFCLNMVQQVAVLEPETYGLASLKRSFKILKANFPTVLGVYIVGIVLFVLLAMLQSMAMPSVRPEKLPHWTLVVVAALSALLYFLFMSYWTLVVVVLYFCCKLKYDASEQWLPKFRQSGEEDSPYRPQIMSVEN
uniref:Uncharacterized protein n=1 Tax=Physcomitrium patens TaxID=3218 RepID=A0A2K1KUY1_PHYPA|nr:hypothetical protein PHYPA_004583 [Physcomitrium patens]